MIKLSHFEEKKICIESPERSAGDFHNLEFSEFAYT